MKNLKQLLERMEYTLVQGSVDREITELIYGGGGRPVCLCQGHSGGRP